VIRNIKRTYFEIWGTEEAQNSFLKGVLLVVSILFAVQSIGLLVLALRKPDLIGVGNQETKLISVTPPGEELLRMELKRLVRGYIEAHYNWDFGSVEKAHEKASRYVSEKFVKAFNTANAEQVRVAKEKKVTQRVHVVGEIPIDSKTLSVRVAMDRILIVEGLRVAQAITLDISFEYGPRTETNPEGIYITGEKLISSESK